MQSDANAKELSSFGMGKLARIRLFFYRLFSLLFVWLTPYTFTTINEG